MIELRQFLDKFIIYTTDKKTMDALGKHKFHTMSVYKIGSAIFAKEFLFSLPKGRIITFKEARSYLRGKLGKICRIKRKR